MLSRRALLKSAPLVALGFRAAPALLARAAAAAGPMADGRVLVVVHLDGGNDGVNTVVPFADEGYARHRKELRLEKRDLLRVDDRVGLHPALRDAARLLEGGRLAVVQGVGYSYPAGRGRSHFESADAWHTARLEPAERDGRGWVGRALDGRPRPADQSPDALSVGPRGPSPALRGRVATASALARLDDFVLLGEAARPDPAEVAPAGDDLRSFVQRGVRDAHAAADRLRDAAGGGEAGTSYPATGLGGRLRLAARLIKAGFGTRVYYTTQPGYDTHASQAPAHARLLTELAGALRAFLDDLAAAKLADRVLVLCFSEFGRTVRENGTFGTDHGTAGPVLVAGPAVRAGILGDTPSLTDLDPVHGDLRVGIDFRRVYATLLDGWLGVPHRPVLGGAFEPLPVLRG